MCDLILGMIVKNEARHLGPTLASALPFIDGWIVNDTGSVDGTQEVIREALSQLPGVLLSHPFVDFSEARGHVMRAAEQGQTVLWLDADDELVDGASLRALLAAVPGNCFSLRHDWSDGQVFFRPSVVRAGSGWHFTGRVHEVLTHPTDRAATLVGPSIRHTLTPETLARSQARYPRDVAALQLDLADDPQNTRAAGYLDLTQAVLRSLAT